MSTWAERFGGLTVGQVIELNQATIKLEKEKNNVKA